jgi:hypothetical protein
MNIIKIIDIKPSEKANKRFQVTMNNGETFDFGYKNGSTYIDHHDKIKRNNYWARHQNHPKEKELLLNFIPSPSLFSAHLLWGKSKNINKNINNLNRNFLIKQLNLITSNIIKWD